MEPNDNLHSMVQGLRAGHAAGLMRSVEARVEMLRRLREAVVRYADDVAGAQAADLGKSAHETYLTETGIVLSELSLYIRNLRRWARPRRVAPTLAVLPSRGRIIREPLGVVLIIAPWNYPFQLVFSPLIGAVAAGNCAVVKPSPSAPHTAAVVKRIIDEVFGGQGVVVPEDSPGLMAHLLEERFDHIFFTGGPEFGRTVMEAAARTLTPVTLELGGKSPCIVCRGADVEAAARKIVWGKLLNAGQTCVAPDYILVQREIKEPLIRAMAHQIVCQLGPEPGTSPDYPRIVHARAMERLSRMIEECRGNVVWGGEWDERERYVAPTIIDSPPADSLLMREEIFGPIIPVLPVDSVEAAVEFVNNREKPLALYCFGKRCDTRRIVAETTSGSVAVNDVIMQVADHRLPFGGVGNSGMGRYHGRRTFELFSNERSVLSSPAHLDLPLRYAPYKQGVLRFIKLILR